MEDRYFTVMIVPEKKARVRKIVIPKILLNIVLACGMFSAVLLSYIVLDYFSLLHNANQADDIRLENAKLVSEVERLQSKMVAMNDSLDRINLFAKKLKVITNYQGQNDDVIEEQVELGIGPLTADEVVFRENEEILSELGEIQPKNVTDSSEFIGKVDKQIEALNSKANFEEQSLVNLKSFLDDQEDVLSATPSIWPTRGWVSSNFGYRRSSFTGDVHLHKGIDIATRPGTDVKASADGVVVEAGFRPDYGKVIVIDHGYSISTLYGHNSALTVAPGQKVKRGERIAKVGNTGRSTGAHLHYEVRVNDRPVNPSNYLLN